MLTPRRILLALLLSALAVTGADAASLAAVSKPSAYTGQAALVAAQTINATGAYSSDAVDLSTYAFFGASYLCVSASGTPAIKIEFLQSPTLTDADFVVGAGCTSCTLETALAAETVQLKAINPPPMRYGRIKVTGVGANPADSVCSLTMWMQSIPGAKE